MPPFAVSPPAAHSPGSQVRVDGHDVNLRVSEEPVDDILSGRPQPSLDDDAKLDADDGRHQPDKGMLQMRREFVGARLAQDDRYRR